MGPIRTAVNSTLMGQRVVNLLNDLTRILPPRTFLNSLYIEKLAFAPDVAIVLGRIVDALRLTRTNHLRIATYGAYRITRVLSALLRAVSVSRR